jgi:AbiV family abortive infection protein
LANVQRKPASVETRRDERSDGAMSETHVLDKALLAELTAGAEKVFENAVALYREASILKDNGSLNRALFLFQISLEESAKLEMLGSWATSLLMGHEVDSARVKKAMASHASKNRTNAYSLKADPKEAAAKQRGDFEGAVKAFKDTQQEFHLRANEAKNGSLYVDFVGGTFVSPSERITPEMVSEIAALNEEFLALSFPKLEMLRNFAINPEQIEEQLVGFEKPINELGDEYLDDPVKAIDTLLQEMRERRLEIEMKKQSKQ